MSSACIPLMHGSVVEASHYIHDALTGMAHMHPLPTARRAHKWFLWCEPGLHFALLGQVLLCFFERPAWCATTEAPCISGEAIYPLFGLPMLSRWEALAVESFLLGLLAGRVALEVTYLGFDRYKSSQSHRFSGSLLLLAIADCIASVLTPWCGSLPA